MRKSFTIFFFLLTIIEVNAQTVAKPTEQETQNITSAIIDCGTQELIGLVRNGGSSTDEAGEEMKNESNNQ